MTLARDYYLDQQRIDQQDEITQDLYIQGFTDGYDGKEKNSFDVDYKLGYESGLSTWVKEENTNATLTDNYLPF